MRVLDGKCVAAFEKEQLIKGLAALGKKGALPCLAVVQIGDDKASALYRTALQRRAVEVGLPFHPYQLPASAAAEEVAALLEKLNAADEIKGILLLMPLPEHLSAAKLSEYIAPEKDIDGITERSMGRLFSGKPAFVPCTPQAVMAILAYYRIDLEGKHVVVIGRSNIVGKPLAQLCLKQNATVTVCHSRTKNLAVLASEADILIAAVGRAGFVTADMIAAGAVVIDVGINRIDGKTVGDVDFTAATAKPPAITPVPGGVGAVTTIMVLKNVVRTLAETE